ncbi:MAG: hypothetical protein WBG27_13845 [Candidatus Aquilonibacter sp.]
MKRIPVVCALSLATLLLSMQPVLAARIYNGLNIMVVVRSINGSVVVNPGETSASISWPNSAIIDVYPHLQKHPQELCHLSFGVHAEITGGHYMTIGNRGSSVTCTVCDSDYKRMAWDSRAVTMDEYTRNLQHSTSKIGC